MKSIKLDKERNILFDFNAFEAFEEMSGKDYSSFNHKSAKDTKLLILAGIKNADPDSDITPEIVGKHLNADVIAEISEHFLEALLGKDANEKVEELSGKLKEETKQ